jgi:allantoin racemase
LVKRASDQGARAIIIGCFDDTGLDEARNIAACPVVGIGQAAYHLAALAGERFSVVTTLAVSIATLEENIRRYGLMGQLARVRASNVPVLELETAPEASRVKVLDEVARAAAQDEVQSIILGCAGMVDLHGVRIPGQSVLLIDGVRAATKICTLF